MKAFIKNIISHSESAILIDKMIKYVIFDMDGTLLDTEPIYERSWVETGRRWGLDGIGEMYAPLICGRTIESSKHALKSKFGENFDADRFVEERMSLYRSLAETELKLKPYCREVLDFLKANGIKIALGTSTVAELTYSNLLRMGIKECFNVIVTSDDVTFGKPAPDIFLKAAKRLGALPEECIVCEDSYSGIVAAHNAKMMPVFIPDRLPPNRDTDMLSFATLKDLKDIINLIKKENNIS